jgi:hypothetical protein
MEPPGLAVVRGWRPRCRAYNVGDQIVSHRLGQEAPDRAPAGDGRVQIGCIVAELSSNGAG